MPHQAKNEGQGYKCKSPANVTSKTGGQEREPPGPWWASDGGGPARLQGQGVPGGGFGGARVTGWLMLQERQLFPGGRGRVSRSR